MCSARPNRLGDSTFENSSQDEDASIESPHKSSCGCNCGCMCCGDNTNDKVEEPIRGRSLTPKHDRTNGTGDPVEARPAPGGIDSSSYNMTSSVNGQEGLPIHQMERSTSITADDVAVRVNDSIERWLTEHHIPEHPYGFPGSPNRSMIVEASTAPPSSASSGFLPPRTATSDELTTFTYGGFDEQSLHASMSKGQTCAFTPLWLTHELRYCRNFQRGSVAESGPGYPDTIDVDDILE